MKDQEKKQLQFIIKSAQKDLAVLQQNTTFKINLSAGSIVHYITFTPEELKPILDKKIAKLMKLIDSANKKLNKIETKWL